MNSDPIILTLDAGGQSLRFQAVGTSGLYREPIELPTPADNLTHFLKALREGFAALISEADSANIRAISFAFPGPADYANGVIGDLPNLPAFRGGVALGPWLEEQFGIPVFINNDGDMFALGEGRYGFLPRINKELEAAGSERRYHHLLAVTLGTGLGGGLLIHDRLVTGDSGSASELWLFRNKRLPYTNAEDTVSTRAIKKMYAEQIQMNPDQAPDPEVIHQIALGKSEGIQPAARESWLRYGEVLGDVLANAGTVVDAAIVIGGGLSGAWDVFSGAMFDELNGYYNLLNGNRIERSVQKYINYENDFSRKQFLSAKPKMCSIPDSDKEVFYQVDKMLPVGISVLGTTKAIQMGCFAFAIEKLKKDRQ